MVHNTILSLASTGLDIEPATHNTTRTAAIQTPNLTIRRKMLNMMPLICCRPRLGSRTHHTVFYYVANDALFYYVANDAFLSSTLFSQEETLGSAPLSKIPRLIPADDRRRQVSSTSQVPGFQNNIRRKHRI